MTLPCALAALACFAADPDASPVTFEAGAQATVVATPATELDRRLLDRLTTYLEAVLGEPPRVAPSPDRADADAPVIIVEAAPGNAAAHPEAFTLRTEERNGRAAVVAAGATDLGRKRAVQRLILMSEQSAAGLTMPAADVEESPWIPHREWTICPWIPEDVRGAFYNPFADPRYNIYRYSDDRLAKYAEMFDWMGYSGCQLMETSYTYAQFGTIDAAQQWQRKMAGFVRDNGQEVTLWAWTAEFSGFGWVDPEAVYTPAEGTPAIEDPAVRATFEKYYRRYADLAPHLDRFIAHFFDPGRLEDEEDVFDYMRLLESMLKERNPDIRMGVDCWARGPDYFDRLVENGFGHYLLLPVAWPELYPDDTRDRLHRKAAELDLTLGIWGWYITEYESDQLASMYVNASVIRDVYSDIRASAEIHPITYWSEMEAHHLINVFSMYVAGQLLWDPEADPHVALEQFVKAVWGPENGAKVYDALKLIEDVRSGPTWETYWWTRPEHRIGTADPARDLARAEQSLASLATAEVDDGFVTKFPLPWEPSVFIELMTPHLKQIRDYARFRLDIAEIRKAAAGGAPKDKLAELLEDAWKPVLEYDTWVGVFGTHEQRAQKETLIHLTAELDLPRPMDKGLRYLEADRLLQNFRRRQATAARPLTFGTNNVPQWFWPTAYVQDRFMKLVEDAPLRQIGPNQHQLADWQNWALRE